MMTNRDNGPSVGGISYEGTVDDNVAALSDNTDAVPVYVEAREYGEFDLICEHIDFDIMQRTPTFIGARAGLSDFFAERIILPRVDLHSYRVVAISRHDLSDMSKTFSVTTRSVASIRTLVGMDNTGRAGQLIIGHDAIAAYDALTGAIDNDLKRYLIRRSRFIRRRPARFDARSVLVDMDHTRLASPDHFGLLVDAMNVIALDMDPICYPRRTITHFVTSIKGDIIDIITAIMRQHKRQRLSLETGIIVIIDIVDPIDTQLSDALRDLLRWWRLSPPLILWLHGAIRHVPDDTLDQFQNYIVLHPTPADLEDLRHMCRWPMERNRPSDVPTAAIVGPFRRGAASDIICGDCVHPGWRQVLGEFD